MPNSYGYRSHGAAALPLLALLMLSMLRMPVLHAQVCDVVENTLEDADTVARTTRLPYIVAPGVCSETFCTLSIREDAGYTDNCADPCCIRGYTSRGTRTGGQLEDGHCVITCASSVQSAVTFDGPPLAGALQGSARVQKLLLLEAGEFTASRIPYRVSDGLCPESFCENGVFQDDGYSDNCADPVCIRHSGDGGSLAAEECVATCASAATSPINFAGPSLGSTPPRTSTSSSPTAISPSPAPTAASPTPSPGSTPETPLPVIAPASPSPTVVTVPPSPPPSQQTSPINSSPLTPPSSTVAEAAGELCDTLVFDF